MTWGAIGAVAGAILGFAVAFALNIYVLSVVDWAKQDVLSGGIASPVILALVGAVAGGFLGLIIRLSR